MDEVRKRLGLKESDQIKQVSRRDKGHLGQTEECTYDILSETGELICKARVEEHQPVGKLRAKPTFSLVRLNKDGGSPEHLGSWQNG
ncbi:hypothetical protein [Vogesella sp. EB]|uniref:hypothetical protein n=1 Tax=Vogesella sp. EB TaxID=1526735 RepID=UPI0012E00573|nr:hypothetical protein [Vogesella sp. EB]